MEMSLEVQEAINKQITVELESAYLYLSMSLWFGKKEFKNLEKLYFAFSKEEFEHAMKFTNHITEMGGEAEFSALKKPKSDWNSVKEIVEATYEHEKFVTGQIHKIVTLIDEKNEYASQSLLGWFVEEQVEEEVKSRLLMKMQAGFKNDWLFDHRARR
ncbi:MAG: putative ferritin-1 [Candidatus Heimdallarchaeota archaeon LC_3]|nr:MAG: putative ferritin-1 [Candidatus Heimdallarchaeota archaeon LC_3]